jgi:amino acid adenylation domain-containing protein/non-ribosomal peptide synthase protein (TIGR01720 family)
MTGMTENQFLVWAAQRLQPDNALYRIGFAFTIPNAVEYAPFQEALQTLINSSDSLRSIVTEDGGIPRLGVIPDLPYTLPYVDLSPATRSEYNAWARERFGETRFGPEDPPFDTALVKLSQGISGWYLCTNHLFTDGWSLVLALRHMADFYQRAVQGELPARVELPQFRDYVAYERAARGSDRYRQAEAYWQEKLSRPLEPVRLYGRLRPTDQTRADRVSVELGVERSRRLRELARHPDLLVKNENVTLFNIFVALLAAYVSRVSDVRRISIGSPFLGRPTESFMNTIGLFVEVLPFHIDVQTDDTFVSLVQRVAAEARETLRHRQIPVRNPIDQPAYELSVNYPPQFLVEFNGAPVSSYWIPHGHQTVSVALTFHDYEGTGNLTLDLDLHCDVFPEPRRSEAMGHFLQLLDSFLENPRQAVVRASLLPPADRRQLMVDFARGTDAPWGTETVVDLFEVQAEHHPQQPALVFEDQSLTYAELDGRANQLARHLRELGVGPETLVGLSVERSPEMIVGLLAILKAGGAYVPLDPSYPAERLAFMVQDSEASVLLTQAHLVDRLPGVDAHVISLDTDWPAIADYPATPLGNGANGRNLAYVIYTSGSTGTPKGVEVEHRALASHTRAACDQLGLGLGDRVLQFMSISFDAAAEEIYPCLTSGATLVLRDDAMLASVPVFLDRCRELDVTMAVLPTAFWHQVVAELSPGAPQVSDRLRLLIVGGERILPERLRLWQEYVGQRVRLINAYGPTEATVVATRCDLTALARDGSWEEVPIGRPTPNVQVYLLDAELQPVPIGVPGEVCIGGTGVARGYLRRPALTAEQFVPDPFGDAPGARLYRTGDMARYLPDGTIEFLGRVDHQVKVRGYRVELGAIEAVLRQHPAVQDATVLAREDVPGEKQLVAYVIFEERTASVSALYSFVKDQLPAYMVPSAFVSMEAFPLTPNGKVDRKALPRPSRSVLELEEAYVAPDTEVEIALAKIWAEVLRLERVGVDDDFFELGGDSILSIQICAKAAQAGLSITPSQLFRYSTVRGLATRVGVSERRVAEQGLILGPVPLTPIQHWFFEAELQDPHHWSQVVRLEVAPGVSSSALERALEALLAHHDALRLQFVHEGSGWQQLSAGVPAAVPFSQEDVSSLPASEQDRVLAEHSAQLGAQIDLSTGTLLRAALFKRGGGRPNHLSIAIHHLGVDGVSWRILLQDLDTAYRQIVGGTDVALPAKTTSFKNWSERLTAFAQSEELLQEAEHWLATLDGENHPLPLDASDREANTVASARDVSVSLDAGETTSLLQDVPPAYNTQINDVLLTALVQSLARWTGSGSPLLDLEGHGREEIGEESDLSRTVGWLTSVFPVRLVLDRPSDRGDALKQIKEQLRQIPSRGIGYGLLRYLRQDAEIRERLTSCPQPEIAFNYLGQFDRILPDVSPFRLADEPIQLSRSERSHRRHLIEINAMVVGDRLEVDWTYSENLHRRATIETLAEDFVENLRALISHCLSPDAGGYTPSDFPLINVDQRTLDSLVADWDVEDILPLSPMQQALLLHDVAGGAPNQMTFTLRGDLDRQAFRRAWQLVLAQHSVLRTSFVWEGLSEPLQIVHRDVRVPWEYNDWRELPPEDREERLEALHRADLGRRFNLSKPPLTRLALIQVEDDQYDFLWTSHHIQLDGWSAPIILRDVFQLYDAISQGRSYRLGQGRPYSDYLAWLQRQDWSQAEAVWRERLQGFTEPTPLPSSPHRLPATPRGLGHEEATLSRATTSSMKSLVEREQLTLNTLVQGAWALLLGRYSGEDDVVFGTTVSGRSAPLPGIDSMVGVFINALPVRFRLSADDLIMPWLRRIRDQQMALSEYEHTPLTQIQAWSDVPGYLRLFDSLLVFENYPVESLLEQRQNGLEILNMGGGITSSYSLTIVALPGETLSLSIIYDRGKFASSRVRQILAHFELVLENIAAGSVEHLSDLWQLVGDLPLPEDETAVDLLPVEAVDRSVRTDMTGSVAPRTPLETQLCGIWEEILGVQSIGVTDDFFELGGNSLQVMHMLSRVESELSVNLPLTSVLQGATVEYLAQIVHQDTGPAPWPTLVPIQPQGSLPPFFCVHPGCGDVAGFRIWSQHLGSEQPFYGLRAHGLDGIQEPWDDIEQMAADYIREIRTVQAEGPYYLGGYGPGSTIAFEMAQQFKAQGQEVALLFLINHALLNSEYRRVQVTPRWVIRFLGNLPYWVKEFLRYNFAKFILWLQLMLRPGGGLGWIRRWAERLAPLASLVNRFEAHGRDLLDEHDQALLDHDNIPRDLDRRQRRIGEAFYRAELAYEPSRYPGKITVLRTYRQPFLCSFDPALDWGKLAAGGVELRKIHGSNTTMLKDPDARSLAEEMRICLAKARESQEARFDSGKPEAREQ